MLSYNRVSSLSCLPSHQQPLITTVINKLRGLTTQMLLIAPCWNDAPRLPLLLELLYDIPRKIKGSPGLLINLTTEFPMKDLDSLRLTVRLFCCKGPGDEVEPAIFDLLQNTWRPGTRCQYQSVWKSWHEWCISKCLDPTTISVEKLSEYLHDLFQNGLAWRSVCAYRSGVSRLLEPHKTAPVGQNPLMCQFVRGVFNKRPPSARVVLTSDTGWVLRFLSEWDPPEEVSLQKLILNPLRP